MIEINEYCKWLWLAATIDCEGTIAIVKGRETNYTLRLFVGNTSEELIDYMLNEYGGNKGGPYRWKNIKNEDRSDSFRWVVTGARSVFKMVQKIEPYLVVKNAQADLLIEAWYSTFKYNYAPGKSHLKIPKYAIDKRECYYQEMKKLNLKGRSNQLVKRNAKEERFVHKSRCVITLDNYKIGE